MIHARTLHSLEFGKLSQFLAEFCQSASGKELALAIAPLSGPEKAEAAMSLYEEFKTWASYPRGEKFTFAAFPDTRGALAIAAQTGESGRKSLDLDAFWAIKAMLNLARQASTSIRQPQAPEMWPRLLEIGQNVPFPEQTAAALNRCISDDGLLKDESSPELWRLRNELRRLHQSCLRKVKDFASQYNMLAYLQDEFMTLSSDRYVLPLKANFKGRMQGIIHDWSQTGETCYFEPIFLVEVNNRLQELKHEEREEEKNILKYLASLLESEYAGVRACHDLLSLLDFLNAKHKFAETFDAICPTFTPDEHGIELVGARHPILMLARKGENSSVRPLDIVLRPGERALIITGGNAGGKTVCLKTMGLLAALAMSGMPIPAKSGSHLPWFDRLDAFIGDEQSIDDNVSTFTAQIDHLAKAWKHLDNHGLVLLDEFGAGTDPAEGAALAQAVLDGLLEKKCFVLAATHFPALKTYALSQDGVRAASMLFNPQTGKPLFKLAYDQVGSSQALEVAAAHGLPESILLQARHYLLQDGHDASSIIARLNNLAVERETEIASLKKEQDRTRNILQEKRESLDKEKARLRDDIRGKISQLMAAWKEGKANAKQTLKEMSGLRGELNLDNGEENTSILPPARNFKTGQTVFHNIFNKRGLITDVDDKRNRVRLDMNGVNLWAEMKDIRESSAADNKKGAKSSILNSTEPMTGLSLDVRGMRADEAILAVERFLDKAVLSGFSEVEIVHGRGTGVLRRQIHDFLRSFPPVERVALAPEDRGGDGMSIVGLK